MSLPFLLVSTARRRRLVRISDLQEILPMMDLAQLEGQRGRCRGLANLRGELIPVFDAAGSEALLSSSRFILVLRESRGLLGLIVDDVQEVLSLSEEQVPLRWMGGERPRQVGLLGEELLPVLEPEEIVTHVG